MGEGCGGFDLVEFVMEPAVLEGGGEVGEGFTLEAKDAGGLDVEEVTSVFLGEGRDRPMDIGLT